MPRRNWGKGSHLPSKMTIMRIRLDTVLCVQVARLVRLPVLRNIGRQLATRLPDISALGLPICESSPELGSCVDPLGELKSFYIPWLFYLTKKS